MCTKKIALSIFVLMLSPLFIHASKHDETMESAHELFKLRSDQSKISDAKKIYLRFLKDKHQDVSVKKLALDRYARLAVFEGEINREGFKVSHHDAAKIFDDCIDATDYISPEKIGMQTPEYTYWRAMCIGLWGANAKAKVIFKPGRIGELQRLIEVGQSQFKSYDGYGFNRIQAGMYVRSKFLKAVRLYDPERSLQFADETISQGNINIYMVFVLKAEALVALNRNDDAKKALAFGMDELKGRLAKKTVDEDLRIENEIFLMKMNAMYQSL